MNTWFFEALSEYFRFFQIPKEALFSLLRRQCDTCCCIGGHVFQWLLKS